MEINQNIRVKTDPACTEPLVVIHAAGRDELVERIIEAVSQVMSGDSTQIAAYSGKTVTFLNSQDIVRAFTENRKLTICVPSGKYEARMSLKDLEERLKEESFVRISRFELINLKKVSGFDMNIAGTIKVMFEDGTESWVARRYVKSIQLKLKEGIGR
ncbi:MAG: LytTR family transcriptional regulator DNA-binding domain-containing protein [Lachnospiraceae bacterium]|nr:LytTR family transcriptional regulator DNA-binding domain-containing protein [Lachnospiraceae bacterium]